MNEIIIIRNKDLPEKRNDCYHWEYTPFISPNFFDIKWFNSKKDKFKQYIKNIFPDMILTNFNFPLIKENYLRNHDYVKFLTCYKKLYTIPMYRNVYNDINMTILKLSDEDIIELINYISKFLTEKIKIKISDNFINKLNLILDDFQDEGAFIKTQFKSSKKTCKPLPIFNSDDFLKSIENSVDIMNSLLLEEPSLIIRKWESKIKKENEFRIIILDNKVKGISTQYFNPIDLDNSQIVQMVIKAKELWVDISCKVIFDSACIDVCWIDNNSWYLIEINSGERFSTAGTSLLTWDQLYKTDKIIFSFLENVK